MALPDSQKKGNGCGGWFFGLLVVLAGWMVFTWYSEGQLYADANQAMSSSDCETANSFFIKIINGYRLIDPDGVYSASVKGKTLCDAYLVGVMAEREGNSSMAILNFYEFIKNYERNVLTDFSKENIALIFTMRTPEQLADEALCSELDTLANGGYLPSATTTLPSMYYACGRSAATMAEYAIAINWFDRFITKYPSHTLRAVVEDELARTLLRYAQSEGGSLPAPQQSGSTNSGASKVIIQNDSPEKLRIVFSGADTRIEVLDACPSCQTYSLAGPQFCPEKGPIGEYTMPPGTYQVAVQAMDDSAVTPWSGSWPLGNAEEYYSCFFITTTSYP